MYRILSTLFFWGFLPVAAYLQITDPYPPSPVPDRVILTWSGDPATTQSVTWRTDVSVNESWAEIAPASADPYFRVKCDTIKAKDEILTTNRNVAKFHSVTFTKLKPGTQYAYRVGDGTNYSEWFHFKTAKSHKAPFSFIYFGDAQNDVKSLWARCIREAILTMPDADFLLHAGDLINIPREDKEWGEWFYAGGWINGMKSVIATPGNHEYYRNGSDRVLTEHWKPSFTFPENGPEGLKETVFYIDYQGVRIISLNTQSMLADPESLIKQKEWLQSVLEKNNQRWTIVTQHHPIYSTASGRNNKVLRQNFQPLFEEYEVDLVLQGHDHAYGRGYNMAFGRKHRHRGPMYVVSVSGPKMYNLNFEDWLERVASNTQLYQLIHIDGNTLKYEAYTAIGEQYDAFELKKRKNGTNRFRDLTPPGVLEQIEIARGFVDRMSNEEIERYLERFRAYKARKESKKQY